jgi:hypothetical protein
MLVTDVYDTAAIDAKIAEFKTSFATMSSLDIIRHHILGMECHTLSNSSHFDLRNRVSTEFEIHPSEVFVVGSAKLGFSIAPQKLYRHFCDTSDVDVVVVSPKLFDLLWKKLYSYEESGG